MREGGVTKNDGAQRLAKYESSVSLEKLVDIINTRPGTQP